MKTYPAQCGFEEFSIPDVKFTDELDVKSGHFAFRILEGECEGETVVISNVRMEDDTSNTEDGVLEFDISSSVKEDDSKYNQIVEISQNMMKSVLILAFKNAAANSFDEIEEGSVNEDVAN